MDIEEREVFPVTSEQTIFCCLAQIEGLTFPAAPAKQIKTRGTIDIMELMHFGFV